MSSRGPIIAVAIMAVVAVLAVFFLILPKMNEVSTTQEKVAAAEARETALRAQLASLKEAQANAPQVKAQTARLANQVPPTADLPALIRLLTAAAESSGVDFFTMAPGNPVLDPTGSFSTIPTMVTLTGGYFALDQFLVRLESLPRAAKVISVAITPGGAAPAGATGNTLSMQLAVDFFTTDTSAGPGSAPGPTEGGAATVPSAFTPPSPVSPSPRTPSSTTSPPGA